MKMLLILIAVIIVAYPIWRYKKEKKMKRKCRQHVWRKDYLNGGKRCQVCTKKQEEPERAKDVEP